MDKYREHDVKILKQLNEDANRSAAVIQSVEKSLRAIERKYGVDKNVIDASFELISENVIHHAADETNVSEDELKVLAHACFAGTMRHHVGFPASRDIENDFEAALFGKAEKPDYEMPSGEVQRMMDFHMQIQDMIEGHEGISEHAKRLYIGFLSEANPVLNDKVRLYAERIAFTNIEAFATRLSMLVGLKYSDADEEAAGTRLENAIFEACHAVNPQKIGRNWRSSV